MNLRAVFLLALTCGCGCPAAALAAPLDLGEGLSYVRLHRLPDDLALLAAAWPAPALIVDLRYPTGEGASALPAELPARPRAAPLFVLVGPVTPAGLLTALRERAPGLITLGPAAPECAPDIALAVKAEADRRAYDAFDAGASIESLTSEKDTKPRFDEAVLAREHGNGAADDSRDDTDSGDGNDSGPPAAAPAAPASAATALPLKDAVLERAVQLHRTLRALGLLPPAR